MFKIFTRKFSLIFLFILVITIGLQLTSVYPVTAQSDTAVRSELTSLRSRISRLEAEVSRLSSSGGGSRSTTSLPSSQRNTPQVVDGQIIGESDPLFANLATLVIELKEDVRNLQKRVTALEGKL